MGHFLPVFAYVGPETILPVTSALAAIAGLFLAMGRSVKGVLGVMFRPFRKTGASETTTQSGDSQ